MMMTRKQNRLKNYDYSQYGAYFITICVQNRMHILCEIIDRNNNIETIKDADDKIIWDTDDKIIRDAGTSSPTTTVQLSEYGKIVEMALQSIRLDDVKLSVDIYAIMPDHIHFILTIAPNTVGGDVSAPRDNDISAPRDTPISASCDKLCNSQVKIVPRVVTWFKRFTNKKIGFNIWQRSYYDHIIRNEQDYWNIYQYITDNPIRWIQS